MTYDQATQRLRHLLIVQGILIAIGDKSAKSGGYVSIDLNNAEVDFLRNHLKPLAIPSSTAQLKAAGVAQ